MYTIKHEVECMICHLFRPANISIVK